MVAMKLEDVLAAKVRLGQDVHQTPLLTSQQLSKLTGCNLYIKAEFLQKTGAFKARGVLNFIRSTSPTHQILTTFSSGNHGQALTWAGSLHNKKVVVFMPEDASPAKVAAVKGYGGEVVRAGLSSADREQACRAFAEKEGALVVPPYDHEAIIAGQGTAMVEAVSQQPLFDAVLVPTGGGGLLSGTALVVANLRKKANVFACEPVAANDASQSISSGKLTSITYPNTIADGARNLSLGHKNWSIIHQYVAAGLTCTETQITRAMWLYGTYMKQLVEPSGALSLACLLANKEQFAGKTVILIASGGNIALQDYGKLVQQYVSST